MVMPPRDVATAGGRRVADVKGYDAGSSSARHREASSAGKKTAILGYGKAVSDARHSPAVNALLAMLAKDAGTATAIYLHVGEKKRSLEAKELPKCPLYLDGEFLKELKALQMKQHMLNKEMLLKCDEAEKDYQEKAEPLYRRRCELVAGGAENGKGVPGFWLYALLAIPSLVNEISCRDVHALKYLVDINCATTATTDGGKTVKLGFVFDGSNPYFKNTVLTKAVDFKRLVGEDVIVRAVGSQIDWEEGKCLTQMYSGLTKKVEECNSFFNFFKSSDELGGDKRWMMAHHNHITEAIMESVIPHAASLYKKARQI